MILKKFWFIRRKESFKRQRA